MRRLQTCGSVLHEYENIFEVSRSGGSRHHGHVIGRRLCHLAQKREHRARGLDLFHQRPSRLPRSLVRNSSRRRHRHARGSHGDPDRQLPHQPIRLGRFLLLLGGEHPGDRQHQRHRDHLVGRDGHWQRDQFRLSSKPDRRPSVSNPITSNPIAAGLRPALAGFYDQSNAACLALASRAAYGADEAMQAWAAGLGAADCEIIREPATDTVFFVAAGRAGWRSAFAALRVCGTGLRTWTRNESRFFGAARRRKRGPADRRMIWGWQGRKSTKDSWPRWNPFGQGWKRRWRRRCRAGTPSSSPATVWAEPWRCWRRVVGSRSWRPAARQGAGRRPQAAWRCIPSGNRAWATAPGPAGSTPVWAPSPSASCTERTWSRARLGGCSFTVIAAAKPSMPWTADFIWTRPGGAGPSWRWRDSGGCARKGRWPRCPTTT